MGRDFGGRGGSGQAAAVPVEVAPVLRRDIASFIETNGILEAENEVDIVARTSAPIVELLAEEGMDVREGQLLARLDEEELQAQVEIARVNLNDAEQVHTRSEALFAQALVSSEAFEQSRADYEAAQAQLEASRIQLGYVVIRAPFAGKIVQRYVDFAEQVSANTPLFRLSDFDPLLCPIQVPERELPRLFDGQRAHLNVESWPDEQFDASVLRISPVIDSATGTVKVTLQVDARNRLRPGMFARVFLQTDSRPGVLVIPRSALSLESIGDTVYVAEDGVASRREVELGFREGDSVEVISGLSLGEPVVVVGQDGLSDGTPVQILGGGEEEVARPAPPSDAAPVAGGRGMSPSAMSPEQIEALKERMRARGMTDEQIEARLQDAGPGHDGRADRGAPPAGPGRELRPVILP
jgi:RND family efflux transporter MFP subunit